MCIRLCAHRLPLVSRTLNLKTCGHAGRHCWVILGRLNHHMSPNDSNSTASPQATALASAVPGARTSLSPLETFDQQDHFAVSPFKSRGGRLTTRDPQVPPLPQGLVRFCNVNMVRCVEPPILGGWLILRSAVWTAMKGALVVNLSSVKPQLLGLGQSALPTRATAAAVLLDPPHLQMCWSKQYMLDTLPPEQKARGHFSCMKSAILGGNTDL
jgi:hypothetical protein